MNEVSRYRDLGRHNVRLFGVTNDGLTDVTTAAHALRDTAGEDSILFFPAGTYLVSGLTNNVANQTWQLEAGATITLADSSDTHAVTLSGDGSRIVGGVIEGNGANQAAGAGIVITGDGCSVDGTVVQNTKSYGIYAPNNNKVTITRATVIDSTADGIFVEASSASSADVLDCRIEGCHVDRTGKGVGVSGKGIMVHGYTVAPHSAIGTVIAHNIVRMPSNPTSGAAICIEVFGLSPQSKIIGNACYGGGMGISVDSSDFSAISANTVYGQKTNGIEIAGSEYCAVSGNTVDGNALGTIGIVASNSNTGYNAITGNIVSGCVTNAIKLQTSPFSTVTGNVVKHAVANYCINVISSGDSTLSGNAIDGQSTATKGIVLDTCDGIAITGNSIKDCTQHGVLVTVASAVTLDDITVSANSIDNCNVPVGTSASGGGAIGGNVRAQANGGVTQNGKSMEILDVVNNVKVIVGSGAPESVVFSSVGSLYLRTDGGASTTLYIKESGTSNTGWRAV